jgi:DNA-binding transcriptional ArsR family regulator
MKLATNAKGCYEAAELLKAIAHPLRLRIVAILISGDENVSRLAERLQANQAVVSQQLRLLRMRNLVSVVRQGGFSVYHLMEPQLVKMLACLEDCIESQRKR